MVEVLTYQIVWMLDHYKVDMDEYIKGLKQTLALYREEVGE